MTCFANFVRFVFINSGEIILHDSSKEHSFIPRDRAKAEVCKAVLGKIESWVFVLTLSGCVDIYNMFGLLTSKYGSV